MTIPGSVYQQSHYTMFVTQKKKVAKLSMRFNTRHFTTKYFPHAVKLLKQLAPKVLHTTCFNEDNLPFCEEVKSTELGHLYEHILLEVLVRLKTVRFRQNATYQGVTSWNWYKDEPGTFQIEVDIGESEKFLLFQAILETNRIVDLILENGKDHSN